MGYQFHHMSSKTVTIILTILLLAVIPVYWLRLAYTNIPIRDGLYLSSVVIAVIAGSFAIYKYGVKHSRRLTLFALTAAVASSLISEIIFEYHYVIDKHNIPFPSIADFFSLFFYVFFLIALINEIRLAKVDWKHFKKRLLIIPIIISIILIGVVSYFGVYKAYDSTVDLFTNIVAMAYGVGDLLLIITSIFLVILVREYRGGRFAKIWLILLTGFVFFLAADITWSFYPNQYHDEVWFYKSLLDTLWMIGYLCFAQTLFQFGFSIADAYKMASIDTSNNAKPLTLNDTSTPKES
jgi:hypothetical protein